MCRVLSSGVLCHVVRQKSTDFLGNVLTLSSDKEVRQETCLAYSLTQKMKTVHSSETQMGFYLRLCLLPGFYWFLIYFTLRCWRWRQYILQNFGWFLLEYIVLQPQKKVVFIATSMRTSNPTGQFVLYTFGVFCSLTHIKWKWCQKKKERHFLHTFS